MHEAVIKLARYYLYAEVLEGRQTALPLTDEEMAKLKEDIEELAQVIDQAAEGWFARQKQLEAARRAFKA